MSFIARRQPAYRREPFMRGRNQHIFCKDIYFFSKNALIYRQIIVFLQSQRV